MDQSAITVVSRWMCLMHEGVFTAVVPFLPVPKGLCAIYGIRHRINNSLLASREHDNTQQQRTENTDAAPFPADRETFHKIHPLFHGKSDERILVLGIKLYCTPFL